MLVLQVSCGGSDKSSNKDAADSTEHLAGGEATVPVSSAFAFSHPSRNMTDGDRVTGFNSGNHFFENPWVEGTASTQARDGLGPYFNSRACQNCHINDGRGHAPAATVGNGERGDDFSSMLIRVSRSVISSEDETAIDASMKANVGDDNVGGQLQHKSIAGVMNEAELAVSYTSKIETFADGETITLRIPTWHMTSNFGAFNSDSVFSARVSPPMIGLGLLQRIDAQDIRRQEDVIDSNDDGISGKANTVWSLEDNATALGRFGWKAGQPSLLEQTSGAFLGDMGLTSKFHIEENCHSSKQDCLNAPSGLVTAQNTPDDDYEVTDSILSLVRFYTHHLAVPERRDAYGDEVQAGKVLFNDAGCTACHTPSYQTGDHIDHPELSNQRIFPYTDMLLHNMGEALADFNQNSVAADSCENLHDAETAVRVEFQATACEWRTPPLWGLGLTKRVDSDATFLHDGRAETIMEAVLWHGGEAEIAKQNVLKLSAKERGQFLAFLNDL